MLSDTLHCKQLSFVELRLRVLLNVCGCESDSGGLWSADRGSDWTPPHWTAENGEHSNHMDLGTLQLGPGPEVGPGRPQPGVV